MGSLGAVRAGVSPVAEKDAVAVPLDLAAAHGHKDEWAFLVAAERLPWPRIHAVDRGLHVHDALPAPGLHLQAAEERVVQEHLLTRHEAVRVGDRPLRVVDPAALPAVRVALIGVEVELVSAVLVDTPHFVPTGPGADQHVHLAAV